MKRNYSAIIISLAALFMLIILALTLIFPKNKIINYNFDNLQKIENIQVYRKGKSLVGTYLNSFNYLSDNGRSNEYTFVINGSKLNYFNDPAIIFTSHFLSVSVYQDDELLSNYDYLNIVKEKFRFYGGVRVIPIRINPNYQSSTIKIVARCYNDERFEIKDFYIGNYLELVVAKILDDELLLFFGISIITIFISLLLFSFLFSIKEGKLGILSLSLLSLFVALYVLSTSEFKNLLSSNIALCFDVMIISLYLFPSILCLYINENFNYAKYTRYRSFEIISTLYTAIGLILNIIFIIFSSGYYIYLVSFAYFFISTFLASLIIYSIYLASYKGCNNVNLQIGLSFLLLAFLLDVYLANFNVRFIATDASQILFYISIICFVSHTLSQCSRNSLSISTKRKQLLDSINRDPLTHCLNRRAFNTKVESINTFCDYSFTLIVCDINNFKSYNDTHGHQAGDILLQSFANQALTYSRKHKGVVYRIGGDEFVILNSLEDQKSLDTIEEELTAEVKDVDFACGSSTYYHTLSTSFESVFRLAEMRMYKNKHHS